MLDDLDGALRDVAKGLDVGEERELGDDDLQEDRVSSIRVSSPQAGGSMLRYLPVLCAVTLVSCTKPSHVTVRMLATETRVLRGTCPVAMVTRAPGLSIEIDDRGRLRISAEKQVKSSFDFGCADGSRSEVEITVESETSPDIDVWPPIVNLIVGESRVFKAPCKVQRMAESDGVFDVRFMDTDEVRLVGAEVGKHTELIWCEDGPRVTRLDVGEK